MEGTLTITDAAGASQDERLIKLAGPLTITTMFDFRDTFRSKSGAKNVILDMTEVPYVDSAGMGSIVNAHVSCANSGNRLALVGINDRIRTLLKVTRMDGILAIYPSIEDARQGLGAA